MKHTRIFFAVLAMWGAVFLAGCSKEVEIDIESPADGSLLSRESPVDLRIRFESSDEALYELQVALFPTTKPDSLLVDLTAPNTALPFSFDRTVDLSGFASGATFRLEARACSDSDCADTEGTFIQFGVQ